VQSTSWTRKEQVKFDRERILSNAVAHATGARIRDLPLLPERVKAALS